MSLSLVGAVAVTALYAEVSGWIPGRVAIFNRLFPENRRDRGSDMAPTVGFLGAEREPQRLRGVRGQDDGTEIGRRVTS